MAEFHSLDGTPLQGRIASALLPRFSTQPLPPVTTRGRSGAFSQVIDFPALAAEGRERNVVLAYRVPRVGQLPPTQSPAIYCEVVGVSEPAQRMLADVYLHRSLTAGCTPSMSLFLGHRQVECDLTDRWFERLSGSPPLTLLGSGVSNAWTEAYDWHAALTEHVFATLGWSPSDFEGFRCDEPYPQWGCDYVMAFDYRREQPA